MLFTPLRMLLKKVTRHPRSPDNSDLATHKHNTESCCVYIVGRIYYLTAKSF